MAFVKYKWQRLICSEDGPKKPSTKLVLLNLSLRMDSNGQSCFPSIKTQSTEIGLSERAIMRHLNFARQGGWIKIRQKGLDGQRWRRNEYEAATPDKKGADKNAAPPEKEGGDILAKGGDILDRKVGSGCPTNNSSNSSLIDHNPTASPSPDLKAKEKIRFKDQIEPDIVDRLVKLARNLSKISKGKFNSFAFIQLCVNSSEHPKAITGALEFIYNNFGSIDDCWGYGIKAVKSKSQFYRSREHEAESHKFKQMVISGEFEKLIDGIGRI